LLHSFEYGTYTDSPLVMDSLGNIFGTTSAGGTNGYGRIFELRPSGRNWIYSELYDFTGGKDGGTPLGGLVLDSTGNLYGTTAYYGSNSCSCGVVFEFTP